MKRERTHMFASQEDRTLIREESAKEKEQVS